jgi:hypothetical protein
MQMSEQGCLQTGVLIVSGASSTVSAVAINILLLTTHLILQIFLLHPFFVQLFVQFPQSRQLSIQVVFIFHSHLPLLSQLQLEPLDGQLLRPCRP